MRAHETRKITHQGAGISFFLVQLFAYVNNPLDVLPEPVGYANDITLNHLYNRFKRQTVADKVQR